LNSITTNDCSSCFLKGKKGNCLVLGILERSDPSSNGFGFEDEQGIRGASLIKISKAVRAVEYKTESSISLPP